MIDFNNFNINKFQKLLKPYSKAAHDALIAASKPAAGTLAVEQSSYLLPDGIMINLGKDSHDMAEYIVLGVLPEKVKKTLFGDADEFDYEEDYDDFVLEMGSIVVELALPGSMRLSSASDDTQCFVNAPLTSAQYDTMVNWVSLLQAKHFNKLEVIVEPDLNESGIFIASLTTNTADEIVKALDASVRNEKVQPGVFESITKTDFSDALIEEYQ